MRISAGKLVRARLVDSRGERLGGVNDVIVRLAGGGYPPVTGLRVRIANRLLFVPIARLQTLAHDAVQLSGETLNLATFERRPGEVLLREDVLSRRLINVANGRLVHANDILIAQIDQKWRVVGVDPRGRSMLRRIFAASGEAPSTSAVIDWGQIEPFVGHVPAARLLLPLRRLKRLHPAQIADIVERVSHEEGDEIITAVGGDPEFEADVFEELDTHHQLEFLNERSNQEAAEILNKMEPDEVADLILELDQDRRSAILALLSARHQQKVRGLLAYNPTTAGGMMSPDFISVSNTSTVEQALAKVAAANDLPAQAAGVVTIVDNGQLVGTVSVLDLLRARADARVADVEKLATVRLDAHADLEEVALLMSDYNLVALPVVDDGEKILGVITVDDLLEALIPSDWRRRQSAEST
jgi:CBS domain-containing protein